MVDAAVEAADGVVDGHCALEIDGEVGTLGQIVDVDGMEVVAAIWLSLGPIAPTLVRVRLRGQVKGASIWVNDARGRHPDVRVDIDAAIEIRGQEGDVQIPLGHNDTGLRIHLVDIVLRRSQVDVLDAIGGGVEQRLEEDLLRNPIVQAREGCLEELAELRTPDDGRVHIMITARSAINGAGGRRQEAHVW